MNTGSSGVLSLASIVLVCQRAVCLGWGRWSGILPDCWESVWSVVTENGRERIRGGKFVQLCFVSTVYCRMKCLPDYPLPCWRVPIQNNSLCSPTPSKSSSMNEKSLPTPQYAPPLNECIWVSSCPEHSIILSRTLLAPSMPYNRQRSELPRPFCPP